MLLFIVLAVVLITQVVGNLGRSGDVSYSDMRAYFTSTLYMLNVIKNLAGRLQRQLCPPQL